MPRTKLSRLSKTRETLVIGASIALIAMGIVVTRYGFGFGDGKKTTTKRDASGKIVETTTIDEPGKNLWDWLGLLGVPATLAIVGYVIQEKQQKRASDETAEEVLQLYFDRISTLIIDKNLLGIASGANQEEGINFKSNESQIELLDAGVDVIRARTLSILRRFEKDPERKTSVIRFLIESDVLEKTKLSLQEADLSNTDLGGAKLSNAKLSFSNLSDAKLFVADLSNVDFSNADLSNANLSFSKLSNANLRSAKLSGANFTGADLSNADFSFSNLSFSNLSNANLSNANLSFSNLSGANLSNANLSNADLSGAKLNGALNLDVGQILQAKTDNFTKLPIAIKAQLKK